MTTPRRAFQMQRYNAKRRGISWRLTFDEWLLIWRRSRKLHLRGRYKGQYVMARHHDTGAYEVGNVSIVLVSDNSGLPHKGRRKSEAQRAKTAVALRHYYKDPKQRHRLSELRRREWANPKQRAKRVRSYKKVWQDQEYRRRMLPICTANLPN